MLGTSETASSTSHRRVVVTFAASPEVREALAGTLGPLAVTTYLPDIGRGERAHALRSADAVIAWHVDHELDSDEFVELAPVGLLQLFSAGADGVPFELLPPDLPVATNAGAYAEPMAEHVLALALALAKRLPQNHLKLTEGVFDQTPTKEIDGTVVGILGFGGIGQATAKRFRPFGTQIHAINRSRRAPELTDWYGTLRDLDHLLAAADILVIALPLSRGTRGLIRARELAHMKHDAILVNVARAGIVDEDALYEHMRDRPRFSAGIDTWWHEPRHGEAFSTRRPLLELPNVLGSPHNSALTPGSLAEAARRAGANVVRHLRGEPVERIVDRTEYCADSPALSGR